MEYVRNSSLGNLDLLLASNGRFFSLQCYQQCKPLNQIANRPFLLQFTLTSTIGVRRLRFSLFAAKTVEINCNSDLLMPCKYYFSSLSNSKVHSRNCLTSTVWIPQDPPDPRMNFWQRGIQAKTCPWSIIINGPSVYSAHLHWLTCFKCAWKRRSLNSAPTNCLVRLISSQQATMKHQHCWFSGTHQTSLRPCDSYDKMPQIIVSCRALFAPSASLP